MQPYPFRVPGNHHIHEPLCDSTHLEIMVHWRNGCPCLAEAARSSHRECNTATSHYASFALARVENFSFPRNLSATPFAALLLQKVCVAGRPKSIGVWIPVSKHPRPGAGAPSGGKKRKREVESGSKTRRHAFTATWDRGNLDDLSRLLAKVLGKVDPIRWTGAAFSSTGPNQVECSRGIVLGGQITHSKPRGISSDRTLPSNTIHPEA